MKFSPKLTQQELKHGFIYLAVSLLLIPSLLSFLPLRAGQLNFIYYLLNFCAAVFIFRRFLWQSLQVALDRPFPTLYYSALGYLGHTAIGEILLVLILMIHPAFTNINDLGIQAMLEVDFHLMAIGTVFLVPVAEECLYRGLIFRGFYDWSPAIAYIASMTAFAFIHVMGYIGEFSPLQLLLCFIQYLPAGYCLCFAYRYGGSIISPIIVHIIVNAMGAYNAVR
ncbi:MAG: CPBP family intramembrane metalloprotease [Oscillospiraceae bacterium]|nr:CPBP family intramembrane metalloprotease [Oscillospiraceae bacterium]